MSALGQFYSRHEKAIGYTAIALSFAFCAAVVIGAIPGGETRQAPVQTEEKDLEPVTGYGGPVILPFDFDLQP